MADKLKRRREMLAQAASGQKAAAVVEGGQRKRSKKVSRTAKTMFTTQLATLQDAGLPVLRSLKVLEGQLPTGPMKTVVGSLSEDVETGASLSESMEKHPAVFDDLYVNMIRAGEAGGALTVICNRLATFMEKSEALVRRIRRALVYPIIVMVIATMIVTFIMIYVVPKFEDAFAELGAELPDLTKSLIGFSRWMVQNWWLIVLIPLLIWGAVYFIGRTTKGRWYIDKFILKVPLFGPVMLKSKVALFSRTLGTLSSSGVPLMQALEIVGAAAGNVVVTDAVDGIRTAVREGEPMARPMAETGIFDDIVVNMVDVGEETGELDRMLLKIADNHDAEVDGKVTTLVAFLEPMLIVFMALVVGTIVIALFLPLLKLQEKLG